MQALLPSGRRNADEKGPLCQSQPLHLTDRANSHPNPSVAHLWRSRLPRQKEPTEAGIVLG